MRNVSVLQTNVVHVPHERQERRPHKEFTTACIIHLISNTRAAEKKTHTHTRSRKKHTHTRAAEKTHTHTHTHTHAQQ